MLESYSGPEVLGFREVLMPVVNGLPTDSQPKFLRRMTWVLHSSLPWVVLIEARKIQVGNGKVKGTQLNSNCGNSDS